MDFQDELTSWKNGKAVPELVLYSIIRWLIRSNTAGPLMKLFDNVEVKEPKSGGVNTKPNLWLRLARVNKNARAFLKLVKYYNYCDHEIVGSTTKAYKDFLDTDRAFDVIDYVIDNGYTTLQSVYIEIAKANKPAILRNIQNRAVKELDNPEKVRKKAAWKAFDNSAEQTGRMLYYQLPKSKKDDVINHAPGNTYFKLLTKADPHTQQKVMHEAISQAQKERVKRMLDCGIGSIRTRDIHNTVKKAGEYISSEFPLSFFLFLLKQYDGPFYPDKNGEGINSWFKILHLKPYQLEKIFNDHPLPQQQADEAIGYLCYDLIDDEQCYEKIKHIKPYASDFENITYSPDNILNKTEHPISLGQYTVFGGGSPYKIHNRCQPESAQFALYIGANMDGVIDWALEAESHELLKTLSESALNWQPQQIKELYDQAPGLYENLKDNHCNEGLTASIV